MVVKVVFQRKGDIFYTHPLIAQSICLFGIDAHLLSINRFSRDMKTDLLKHIQTLSNSKLQQFNALETFAQCFNSIYGTCAFISLEITDRQGQCRVRLVFRSDDRQASHCDNYLASERYLSDPQLSAILQQDSPQIFAQLPASLASALQGYHLPTKSMMVIPIFLDGEIAQWVLVLGTSHNQFAEVNLDQAILLANLAGSYMARIDETEALRQANAWIAKELDDIARIHSLLLPQEQVKIVGTRYAALFESCDKAGGDYFDIVNLASLYGRSAEQQRAHEWGAIMADASGHGAAAAVEVAMFDAILRTYLSSHSAGPAEVFNYTNRYYFTRNLRGSFITATILHYDPRKACLTYANAGHPPVIMLPPRGKVRYLDESAGIPLGVQQEWQWQDVTLQVEPGTRFIAYTDGIVDALSPQGEQFGLPRLLSVIEKASDTVEGIVRQVREALQQHQAGTPQSDDQALLALQVE